MSGRPCLLDSRTVGTIVVMGPPGRLGNRLHLYASVIAFSLRHGLRVVNFGFLRYAHYFTGTSGDVLTCAYPSRKPAGSTPGPPGRVLRLLARGAVRAATPLLPLSRQRVLDLGQNAAMIPANFDRLEEEVAGRDVVVIRGFSFRDPEGIVTFGNRIREHFRPVEPHERAVAERARELRLGHTLVGVHLRKGDYRTFQGGRHHYDVSTYAATIRRIAALFPDSQTVSFAVVSDDARAARELARSCPELAMGFGTGHVLEDLYLLAACDRIVGPPSTFSKWASFYGEKPLYFIMDPAADFTLADFEVYGDLRPWRR